MRSLFILLVSFFAITIAATAAPYQKGKITGKITGLTDDRVLVIIHPLGNPEPTFTDTIKVVQGKFSFEKELPEPQVIRLIPVQTIATAPPPANSNQPVDGRPVDRSLRFDAFSIELFVSPGDNMQVEAHLQSLKTAYQVQGSPFNNEYATIRGQWATQESTMASNTRKILFPDQPLSQEELMELQMNSQQNMIQKDSLEKDFVVKNPHHPLSAFIALTNRYMYEGPFFAAFRKLDVSVMTLYIRNAFNARVKREDYLVEYVKAMRNTVVGIQAPDFTLKDEKGESFTLSSLRGKYVALDFWGTWCAPCMQGIPDMAKAWESSKGYVEFVSIDCKDKMEPWKRTIENKQMKWKQLFNDGIDEKNDVILLYGLSGYPSKMIIDPQGKIDFYHMGENPEFYNRLDSLLKELKSKASAH